MYVYRRICVYIYIHTYAHIHMYTNVYTYICTYIYISHIQTSILVQSHDMSYVNISYAYLDVSPEVGMRPNALGNSAVISRAYFFLYSATIR